MHFEEKLLKIKIDSLQNPGSSKCSNKIVKLFTQNRIFLAQILRTRYNLREVNVNITALSPSLMSNMTPVPRHDGHLIIGRSFSSGYSGKHSQRLMLMIKMDKNSLLLIIVCPNNNWHCVFFSWRYKKENGFSSKNLKM